MKNTSTLKTLCQVTALAAALLAAGCAQAVATSPEQAETIDLKKDAEHTKLVLVSNGDSKTFNWTSAQLADPAELEKALAEVPEAQRDKIKQLLEQMKEGKGFQFATAGEGKMMVHHLGEGADEMKVLTNKKVIVHKIKGGDGSEFGLLKSLLTESKLSKEQLQELQKIIDSKY